LQSAKRASGKTVAAVATRSFLDLECGFDDRVAWKWQPQHRNDC